MKPLTPLERLEAWERVHSACADSDYIGAAMHEVTHGDLRAIAKELREARQQLADCIANHQKRNAELEDADQQPTR